jgi:hypothetical protein
LSDAGPIAVHKASRIIPFLGPSRKRFLTSAGVVIARLPVPLAKPETGPYQWCNVSLVPL